MTGWQTTQLTTIFVSAVESSRDAPGDQSSSAIKRGRHMQAIPAVPGQFEAYD
jgi:hypothetical protein